MECRQPYDHYYRMHNSATNITQYATLMVIRIFCFLDFYSELQRPYAHLYLKILNLNIDTTKTWTTVCIVSEIIYRSKADQTWLRIKACQGGGVRKAAESRKGLKCWKRLKSWPCCLEEIVFGVRKRHVCSLSF